MEHFVVYHSAKTMGYELEAMDVLKFRSKKLPLLKKAIGNTVWVVEGIPSKKGTAFTLWGAYTADRITPDGSETDLFVIHGSRIFGFEPPLPLNDLGWFPALKESQANFSLGFNRLNDERVVQALTALQHKSNQLSLSAALPDVDLSTVGTEGAAYLLSHLRRERNRALVEAKKAATRDAKGSLCCEACGFDFSITYGRLGEGFCEVHHLVPLSASAESVVTRLDDLAVLCSNCHRIIHRSTPMLSVVELSKVVAHTRSDHRV